MEGIAYQKYVRCSPKKLRRLAAPLKNKGVVEAESILKLAPSPSAMHIFKAIHSAASNLRSKMGVDAPEYSDLMITELRIDSAPVWKRLKLRARGRADLMLKHNSHIRVRVVEHPVSVKRKKMEQEAKEKAPAKPVKKGRESKVKAAVPVQKEVKKAKEASPEETKKSK